MVRRLVGCKLQRFARNSSRRNLRKDLQKSRRIRKGTLQLPYRPGPPSLPEGNLEQNDETKEDDREEDLWSMGGDSMYRHHEVTRVNLDGTNGAT